MVQCVEKMLQDVSSFNTSLRLKNQQLKMSSRRQHKVKLNEDDDTAR